MKYVGYWKPTTALEASVTNAARLGEAPLPVAADAIDATWDTNERDLCILHLEKKGRLTASYRGSSTCRICGCRNGSQEYTDDIYRWPDGFAHYLKAHAVKPPREFIDHVLANSTHAPKRSAR